MTPELAFIDHLEGSDQPLHLLLPVFPSVERARRAITAFVAEGVVEILDEEWQVVLLWRWKELCRSEEEWRKAVPGLTVRLSERACRDLAGD